MDLLVREHLEDLIDSAKDRNIILINAPSGTGKSTFVNSYIKRRKYPYVWFSLSFKHSDIATFFRDLKRSGITSGLKDLGSLPEFTVEYTTFIDNFSKEFFSSFFNAVPTGTCIVFDDIHNVSPESPVNLVLESAINIAPENIKLFFISQLPPFFKIRSWDTERKILRLDYSHLRVSEEEVFRLFKIKHHIELPKEEIKKIVRKTEGVIAKVLLLDKEERTVLSSIHDLLENLISDRELTTLVKFAEFPKINQNIARLIDGNTDVLKILSRMYINSILVSVAEGVENEYILHDILREFLRHKATDVLGESYAEHLVKIANVLYDEGYVEEATVLFYKAGKFRMVFDIFLKHLFPMIQSNSYYTIGMFLDLLKKTNYKEDPWVLYAEAVINKFDNPEKTLLLLEESTRKFKMLGDIEGEKVAIGEIFDVVQYFGEDFSVGGRFLKRANQLINHSSPSVVDIFLLSYMGIIYLLHKGDSNKALECFKELEEILKNNNIDLQNMDAFLSYVKLYSAIVYDSAGKTTEAEISFQESKDLFERSLRTPQNVFMFNFLASIHEVFVGRFDSAIERMRKVSDKFPPWKMFIHEEHLLTRILEAYLCKGYIHESEEILNRIEKIKVRSTFSKAMTCQLQAQYNLMRGDAGEAIRFAEKSIKLFDQIKGEPFLVSTKSLYALALAKAGRLDQAEKVLRYTLLWARRKGAKLQEFTSLMYLALVKDMSDEKDKASLILKEALRLGKECNFVTTYNCFPSVLSKILSIAFKSGIEKDYVAHIIRFHNLDPPENLCLEDSWPWRIKIYTFGKFRVVVDGREVSNKDWRGSKAQLLLKAILTFGGLDIPVGRIIDVIWDDQDGDKAVQNFEFTLRKLRAVLQFNNCRDQPILLKNKRISLNPKFTWVDIWEFHYICSKIESGRLKGSYEELCTYLRRLKDLYKGKFMEFEEEPWILSAQESWQERFNSIHALSFSP